MRCPIPFYTGCNTKTLCKNSTGLDCVKCPSGYLSSAYYYPVCQGNYTQTDVCNPICISNDIKQPQGGVIPPSDIDDIKNMQYIVKTKYENRIKTPFVSDQKYNTDYNVINNRIIGLDSNYNKLNQNITDVNNSIRYLSGTEVPILRKSIAGVNTRFIETNNRVDSLSSRLEKIEGDIKNDNIVTATKLEQVKINISNSILRNSKDFTTVQISNLTPRFTNIENTVKGLETKIELYNNILQGTVIPGLRKDISNITTLEQVKSQIASDISLLNTQYQKLLKDLNILRSTEIPSLRKYMEDLISNIDTKLSDIRIELTNKYTEKIITDINSLKTELLQSISVAKGEAISIGNDYTNEKIAVLESKINGQLNKIDQQIKEYNNSILGTIIPVLRNDLEDKHLGLKSEIKNSINELGKYYDNIMRILYNASTVFNPQNSTFTPKY